MKPKEYKKFKKMTSENLIGFVTETGEKGVAARYLLERRKMRPLVIAAFCSALAAAINAIIILTENIQCHW